MIKWDLNLKKSVNLDYTPLYLACICCFLSGIVIGISLFGGLK